MYLMSALHRKIRKSSKEVREADFIAFKIYTFVRKTYAGYHIKRLWRRFQPAPRRITPAPYRGPGRSHRSKSDFHQSRGCKDPKRKRGGRGVEKRSSHDPGLGCERRNRAS